MDPRANVYTRLSRRLSDQLMRWLDPEELIDGIKACRKLPRQVYQI